jgi:ribosomal protein S18 acetylase RimI-like enzyme
MNNPVHPLDNPVWQALRQDHFLLGTGDGMVRRYLPDILPFAGLNDHRTSRLNALNGLLQPKERFFVFGDMDQKPDNWNLIKKLACLQMILRQPDVFFKTEYPPEKLNASHQQTLFGFINKIQPGYFRKESTRLGNYFGIFNNGQMISAGGERMRMHGFTEISAICTDPDFTGRGYAQSIIAHLCNENLKIGNIPFLHVLQSNSRAIQLYERMGFYIRRNMDIRHFEKE